MPAFADGVFKKRRLIYYILRDAGLWGRTHWQCVFLNVDRSHSSLLNELDAPSLAPKWGCPPYHTHGRRRLVCPGVRQTRPHVAARRHSQHEFRLAKVKVNVVACYPRRRLPTGGGAHQRPGRGKPRDNRQVPLSPDDHPWKKLDPLYHVCEHWKSYGTALFYWASQEKQKQKTKNNGFV